MKKVFIFFIIFTLISVFLSAQDNQDVSQRQIELPNVVTEIETQTETADTSVIPDFSDLLENIEGSSPLVPDFPQIEIEESGLLTNESAPSQNKIYAEGKLGGGFPSLVFADFSIYELNQDSPFNITFTHDSAAGYGNQSLNDNFNDNTSNIFLEKGFVWKNFDFNFAGSYESEENGLQNKVLELSEVSQILYSTVFDFSWTLPKGFEITSDLGLKFYKRYVDLTLDSANLSIDDWIKESSSFELNPKLKALWSNNNFYVDLTGSYSLNTESNVVNRGQFGAAFYWKNENVKLFTDAALISGNKLNQNQALIPFTLGIDSSFPVKISNRRMEINAKGGMESYRESRIDFEKLYNYTALCQDLTETSDWYALVELLLPIKSAFTSSAKIEYRQTAFGNGIWEASYNSEDPYYGLYSAQQVERKALTSDFAAIFNYKILSFTANWHSNWIYIPVLESANLIDLILTLQSEKANWNFGLNSSFYIDKEFIAPLITLTGMYKITDEVQLLANVQDIVNLFSGNLRTFAGQYAERSGLATIMVKFFF